MSQFRMAAGSNASSVRLVTVSGGMRSSRPAVGSTSTSGKTLTAWIVRTIMIATVAFALLDLSLLLTSVRH
jgi:hypothetical protein